MITQLHGNTTKIDACTVKSSELARDWRTSGKRSLQRILNVMKTILSTRLKDTDFWGVINFMQAFRPNTSIMEIEKALVSYKTDIYTFIHLIKIATFYRTN